ncbi:MAG: enoyl-CoA hydratase/isomerase family protein [Alphaproteobacteria bacterium]
MTTRARRRRASRASPRARLERRPPPPRRLDCAKPVIAAINGVAVGWGYLTALFADIRIASEQARLGEIFVKRGLITDVGGLSRRAGGGQKAAELLFTGDIMDAGGGAQDRPRLARRRAWRADGGGRRPRGPDRRQSAARGRGDEEGLRRGTGYAHAELGAWVSCGTGRLFKTDDHREGVAVPGEAPARLPGGADGLFFDQAWFDARLAERHLRQEDIGTMLDLDAEAVEEIWKDQRELKAGDVALLAALLNLPAAEIASRAGISTPVPKTDHNTALERRARPSRRNSTRS